MMTRETTLNYSPIPSEHISGSISEHMDDGKYNIDVKKAARELG
jgi:hypothetical protein